MKLCPETTVMVCECCWYMKGTEVPAPHWMEWGEWLCSDCMEQAVKEDDDAPTDV